MTEKLFMKQVILKIEQRDYQTEVTRADKPTDIRLFNNSNAVFPAYKSLMHVLQDYENESIHVQTNSYALANEYNAAHTNPNARLLMRLKDLIEENRLDVNIEYVE